MHEQTHAIRETGSFDNSSQWKMTFAKKMLRMNSVDCSDISRSKILPAPTSDVQIDMG